MVVGVIFIVQYPSSENRSQGGWYLPSCNLRDPFAPSHFLPLRSKQQLLHDHKTEVDEKDNSVSHPLSLSLSPVSCALVRRVVEKDLPVAVEDIENETYRKHVVKSG